MAEAATLRGLRPLPPETVGFTAFRSLPDDRGRQYSGVEFTRGRAGADQFFRALVSCGLVADLPEGARAYALLDAINADGDTVETYDLPTRRAFDFVYRKLQLRVVYTDGEPITREMTGKAAEDA